MTADISDSHLVSTNLGRLHVGLAGSGPPAVLWHSLWVDSRSWGPLISVLGGHRRIVTIDGPGYGLSSPIHRDFTLDDCATAACEVLDQLAISEPVDWVGNAWGGHVGVQFAARHPEACRSLLTIATPIHALPPADRRSVHLVHRLHRLAGPRPIVGILANALLGKAFRQSDPEAGAIVRSSFIRADRAGMRQAIRCVSLDRGDATDQLMAVQAPTLMTTGADDLMCTPADTAAWASHVPGGRDLVLTGAGHVAPLFDSKTADVITGFWKS
jgi:pimeloyl-ACP methyl ester carboxylesterase